MTSSNTDPPARETPDVAGSQGSDVIRLGRQVIPASNGRQVPLIMEFELRVEKGPVSESLAREQAAAIRQVLA